MFIGGLYIDRRKDEPSGQVAAPEMREGEKGGSAGGLNDFSTIV